MKNHLWNCNTLFPNYENVISAFLKKGIGQKSLVLAVFMGNGPGGKWLPGCISELRRWPRRSSYRDHRWGGKALCCISHRFWLLLRIKIGQFQGRKHRSLNYSRISKRHSFSDNLKIQMSFNRRIKSYGKGKAGYGMMLSLVYVLPWWNLNSPKTGW